MHAACSDNLTSHENAGYDRHVNVECRQAKAFIGTRGDIVTVRVGTLRKEPLVLASNSMGLH
jgi:hypothetical protein